MKRNRPRRMVPIPLHQLLRAALDEEGSAPFVEDDSAALHGDAKQRRSATVGASFPETQAAAVHPLSRVDRCPSCSACAPTTPRRSWPSNWRTAPTSSPLSPTAAMSSTTTSPSSTTPCWPSRRLAPRSEEHTSE